MLTARTCLTLFTVALAVSALHGTGPTRAAFPGTNGPIVFTHEAPAGDHTQSDVYVLDPGSASARQLTDTPDRNEFGPAWSPDATRIAYWRTKAPFGPGSLWVMNANGRNKRQVTHGFDARDPAWAPNGRRLVFTAARKGADSFDLWTLRLSDGALRRLTGGPSLDFEPAWSPDGTRIAFTRGTETGDTGDLHALDVATGTVVRVTRGPAYDHQVAWSPDAVRLVFERVVNGSSAIYSVGAGGTGLVRLSRGPYFDSGPAYSPDGMRIAFGSDRGGATLSDLWLMRVDGTGKRRLLTMEYAEGFPDWGAVTDGRAPGAPTSRRSPATGRRSSRHPSP